MKWIMYLVIGFMTSGIINYFETSHYRKALEYQTMRRIVIMDWLDGQNEKWHYWANKKDKQKFEDWVNYATLDRLRAIKGDQK